MGDLQVIREIAAEMGLRGQKAIQFVRELQENARTERQLQREADDRAREDAAAARAQELEVIRLKGEPQNKQQRNNNA